MSHEAAPSPVRTWLSTLPALLVLLLAVAQGTSEVVQARMLAVGEQTWPGYSEIRYDPKPPECDVDKIGADAKPKSADDAMLDDMFATPPAGGPAPDGAAPAAPTPDAAAPPPADAVPPAIQPPSPTAPVATDGTAGTPAAAPPKGADDALLDDMFGGAAATGPNTEAIAAAKAACAAEHKRYDELQAMITPSLKAFRVMETTLSAVTSVGRQSFEGWLVLLIAICAATASALQGHIGLRNVVTVMDSRASNLAQLVVNVLVAYSCVARYNLLVDSGLDQGSPTLALVWAAGFIAMAGINAALIARPDPSLKQGGSISHALLAVPLYCSMGFFASVWFLGFESYPAGVANYLDKITGQAGIYLQVGLYVWAGMMLKRTRVAHYLFDAIRPWGLAPELLAVVVLILSAVPTAYSGASGIWVMAAGATVYDEMRRSGARHRLALATTAVSGSLGVVLSPCLLVVIVASLNKGVTTSELFEAGRWVFLLTAVLFTIALIATRMGKLTLASPAKAVPAMLTESRKLLPYVGILIATVVVFALFFDTWLTEHTSALILLDVMLLIIVWDGLTSSPEDDGVGARLAGSTHETTIHIGALLTLMAMSVSFGAIVERADLMTTFMQWMSFNSPFETMMLFVCILVVIGMTMDPYGAVILVSATLAHVAADAHIGAVHFWMTVLVGFELGYLTPPVALNQLLARSVVGEQEDDTPADASFWRRHEDTLLPVTVMAVALLIVAFVPLMMA